MPFTHFECVLCYGEKFEELPRWVGEGGSRICDACARDCVAPRFYAALQHEHHYPPMWGKEKLDFWTFLDLFDDGFREAWREKEEEYAMPVKKRVYCEHRDPASGSICGEFLGRRGLGQKRCERCQCYTCGACGTTSDNATSARNHTCKKATTVDDIFAKFQKGRHYQKCPGCEKDIFPAEGCNHMTCRPPCGTHFCFICGDRVAARQSGHWRRGGCPRFGMSGPRGIWDEPGEHSEDEDFDGDGDGDGSARDLRMIQQRETREQLQHVRRVRQLADIFVEAERIERLNLSVTRVDGERRVAFFGDVLANLNIVIDMLFTRFEVNQIPNQLREFNARDERIRREYDLNRANLNTDTNTVTQLSDLSNELDAYFVFALEASADMSAIAAAHGRAS